MSLAVTDQALRDVSLTRVEYDQIVELLGRDPTPVELGMFGSMWSEHCGYKHSRPLLVRLPSEGPRVVQGPGENAGVVDIGDGIGIAFKIESHNHPSAIEPYQGAATGVGGIVRDIFTMGARPIALADSLRFGNPDTERNRYLLSGVVAGIGGYGNCLGIPTVAGEIFFDSAYNENPLVNAMCVGVVRTDEIMRAKASGPGNLVLAVGADTGRDGIHGATFASVEDPESSHRGVVQVGNPFLEKLLLEACLELLQTDQVVAMQDMGAAGLTSSLVESASKGGVGVEIDVQKVSRREQGMNAYEVMLSESQERMLVIVRQDGLSEVQEILDRWDLHSDVIGTVTDDGLVRILDGGETVAEVPATFYTDECPTYVRPAEESADVVALRERDPHTLPDLSMNDVGDRLRDLLAAPNICSRGPVVHTYDHTIMSNTVVPPIEGDAAVMRIKGTSRGVALKTDCNPRYVYLDPYLGGAHAIAEGARNVSCVGAEPIAFTNCLNFANPEKPEIYFQLERAISGMAEAARALDTPVVSGNVSLYNETRGVPVLPTPTVGMVGLLDDIEAQVGLTAPDGTYLMLLGPLQATLGASEYLSHMTGEKYGAPPSLDLELELRVQRLTRTLIRDGQARAAHDTSEGGLLVAIAEMLMLGTSGARIDLSMIIEANGGRLDRAYFGEAASRVIVAVERDAVSTVRDLAEDFDIPALELGDVTGHNLDFGTEVSIDISRLRTAWEGGLRF